MTELAVRQDTTPAVAPPTDATAPLIAWAHAAKAANDLAVPLCATDFVPAHFRGKPADATAAILYGAEAGLSPLQALQGIYVISGKPAMYARALMAVALSKGHEVWTEELTDTRAIVCGRRKGTQNVERVVWTIDKAKRAGYTSNKKYTTDPQAMLLARAQADVCRRIAPDALMGMAYSVEELEDEQPAETTTAQRTTATAPKRTARRAQPPTPEPDLDPPAEPDDDVPVPPVEVGEGITQPQLKKLHALLNEQGYGDRDAGLRFLSDLLSREVESSKTLTKAEASTVIDAMEGSGQQEPPLDEPSGWGQS